MPSGRVYIVNSPDLVLSVQKLPKKLSFWFVEAIFAVRMGGVSKHAANALQDNTLGIEDRPSLLLDGMLSLHKNLKPGKGLDDLTRVGASVLARSIAEDFAGRSTTTVELWSWVYKMMMRSITEATYGPKNPYNDPGVPEAFQ